MLETSSLRRYEHVDSKVFIDIKRRLFFISDWNCRLDNGSCHSERTSYTYTKCLNIANLLRPRLHFDSSECSPLHCKQNKLQHCFEHPSKGLIKYLESWVIVRLGQIWLSLSVRFSHRTTRSFRRRSNAKTWLDVIMRVTIIVAINVGVRTRYLHRLSICDPTSAAQFYHRIHGQGVKPSSMIYGVFRYPRKHSP